MLPPGWIEVTDHATGDPIYLATANLGSVHIADWSGRYSPVSGRERKPEGETPPTVVSERASAGWTVRETPAEVIQQISDAIERGTA